MSEASKAAENYRNTKQPWLRKAELAGEWCSSSTLNDREGFLAGARALLEWARSKAQFMSDEDGEGIDQAVDISDLESYFAEEKK